MLRLIAYISLIAVRLHCWSFSSFSSCPTTRMGNVVAPCCDPRGHRAAVDVVAIDRTSKTRSIGRADFRRRAVRAAALISLLPILLVFAIATFPGERCTVFRRLASCRPGAGTTTRLLCVRMDLASSAPGRRRRLSRRTQAAKPVVQSPCPSERRRRRARKVRHRSEDERLRARLFHCTAIVLRTQYSSAPCCERRTSLAQLQGANFARADLRMPLSTAWTALVVQICAAPTLTEPNCKARLFEAQSCGHLARPRADAGRVACRCLFARACYNLPICRCQARPRRVARAILGLAVLNAPPSTAPSCKEPCSTIRDARAVLDYAQLQGASLEGADLQERRCEA